MSWGYRHKGNTFQYYTGVSTEGTENPFALSIIEVFFFFLPGWPRRTTWMWWRVYFPRSQSVDPVGKRLQRDVLDVRENGTVTGKTYIDMSPAASWYPHELWNASWYPGSWTTWCKILFILLVFRECQVKHWPKHKKACQLMGTEASETILRDQTINS